MSNKSNSIKTNQSGLVAIVVTLMLMLVVTLITITFAKIIRREQRQALDRQLNTQAFYAAESGINSAIEALKSGPINKAQCNNLPAPEPGVPASLTGANTSIDATNGVSYTCLTINSTPTSLEYGDIDVAQSTVIPVQTAAPISSITIGWQATDNSSEDYDCGTFATTDSFPSYSSPLCGTGILRLDVVPTALLSRAGLLAGTTKTFFLIPEDTAGANSFNYASSVSGRKFAVLCSTDPTGARKACSVRLDGFTGNSVHLRAQSIYVPSALTVTAQGAGAVPLGLIGVQAIVDSTGKANDVLRRVQVRVPLTSGVPIVPGYAIQSSDTVCKRLSVLAGATTYDASSVPAGIDTAPCNP